LLYLCCLKQTQLSFHQQSHSSRISFYIQGSLFFCSLIIIFERSVINRATRLKAMRTRPPQNHHIAANTFFFFERLTPKNDIITFFPLSYIAYNLRNKTTNKL
jgi:hypothetical protein